MKILSKYSLCISKTVLIIVASEIAKLIVYSNRNNWLVAVDDYVQMYVWCESLSVCVETEGFLFKPCESHPRYNGPLPQ